MVSTQRADHEDQRLDRFGVGDRAHAAEHRVDAGQDDDQHRPDPEAVQHDAAERQLHAGEQRAEDDAAGEDADRDLRDHVGDQRHQRQDPARRGREAPLEELRHRVDARPDVERHQHPAEHQQAPGVQLVVCERDTAGGAGTGEADEVLRADVGREDRRADDEPAEVAAGQEVVVGGIPSAPDDPPGHCEQQGKVGQHDEPVEEGHGGGSVSRNTRRAVAPSNR